MKTINLSGCIILDDQKRMLLLHRNTPKRSQWEIPGGKIEIDETAAGAAQREVKEELGLDVFITREIGSKSFDEGEFTMGYSWFQADVIKGTPLVMEPETHDDWRYFSVTELNVIKTELSANTINFLAELRADRISLTA